MSHTFEQYLVSEGNDVSDGFCETILKTVIKNAPICIKDPTNLEARSAMMLASSFGCCRLLAIGNMPSPGRATPLNTKFRPGMTSRTAWVWQSSRRTGCVTA